MPFTIDDEKHLIKVPHVTCSGPPLPEFVRRGLTECSEHHGTIQLYFDEDSMWHALVHALRARSIDLQTALGAAMTERSDEDHLAFATAQSRVLCNFEDLIPRRTVQVTLAAR